MALSKSWDEHVVEHFRERPEEIPGYLDACLEEGTSAFLGGLRHVIESRSGMADAASKARVHRVSLYKMLGEGGNPTLGSLSKVLEALGLRLSVVSKAQTERRSRAVRRAAGAASAR